MLDVAADHHLLDIGCGIGGPARYMAERFNCRVAGIDLTVEFCAVAEHLTRLLGFADRISIHEGDFLPKLERAVEGDFSTPIAFICASGGRGNQISTMLARQGLPNIYDVSEGMVGRLGAGKGWIEDALPVVSMEQAIEAGGLEAADDQSAEATADEDASQ